MRSSTVSKSSKVANNSPNLANGFQLANAETLTGRGLIRQFSNSSFFLRKIVRKKIEDFPFPYLPPFFYIKVFPKNGELANWRMSPLSKPFPRKIWRMLGELGNLPFLPCF